MIVRAGRMAYWLGCVLAAVPGFIATVLLYKIQIANNPVDGVVYERIFYLIVAAILFFYIGRLLRYIIANE
jgi:hypothetical protein